MGFYPWCLLEICLLFSSPFFWLILSQELCSLGQFLRELSVVTLEPRNDDQKIMHWGPEANPSLDRIGCTPYTERQIGPSAVSQSPSLTGERKELLSRYFQLQATCCEFPFSHHIIPLLWVLCPPCFVNHTQFCGVVCKVLVICWLGMLFHKKGIFLINKWDVHESQFGGDPYQEPG